MNHLNTIPEEISEEINMDLKDLYDWYSQSKEIIMISDETSFENEILESQSSENVGIDTFEKG